MTVRMTAAALPSAVLLIVGGCGGGEVAEADVVAPVTIREVEVGDSHYIEGFVPTIRVTQPDNPTEWVSHEWNGLTGPGKWPVGRYHIESWVEPCDGSCQVLDPPTDRCSGAFELTLSGIEILIFREPGSPCRIETRPPAAATPAAAARGDRAIGDGGPAVVTRRG